MTSESDTAVYLPILRDITYREIHSFEDGFYCGVHGITEDEYNDYEQERHYWRVGWLLGDAYDQYVRG